MSADPADIAIITSDGVVLTQENLALRAAHPDARDTGRGEIEMFYDNPAHAAAVLAERFALLSQPSAVHEGIEVADDLGLGSSIPLAPYVPCFRVIDEKRSIDTVARTRALVYQAGEDRFSLEVVA